MDFDPKVLIACEESGTVRGAFLALGYNAFSCDLKSARVPTNRHIQDDVRNVLRWERWDLVVVCHPPCTRLCASGVRWLKEAPKTLERTEYPAEVKLAYLAMTPKEKLDFMWEELDKGAALFSDCWNADVPRVAVENPVMHKYAKERIANFKDEKKFRQTVQPWQFGHEVDGEDNVKKRTCFWLRGLPWLHRTGTLDGSTARPEIHEASATGEGSRSERRSKFFPGMAHAMASQWGEAATQQIMEAA